MVDGHVALVLGSLASFAQVTRSCMGKGWFKQLIQKEPIVAGSMVLGVFSICMPLVIVPIRRELGYPTNQYDRFHPAAVGPVYYEKQI